MQPHFVWWIAAAACTASSPQRTQVEGAAASATSAAGATEITAATTELTYRGPSPQPWRPAPPAPGVEAVTYSSDGRDLKGWLKRPESDGGPQPGLLCLHGGFAFGMSDLDMCQPFVDAGFVVFAPTYRGENGNPGQYQLFLGEVDDAVAAAHYLADLPEVDPARVYAFGHSAGGAIAALMTLHEEPVVAHTGSSGGLYAARVFAQWSDIVPFRDTPAERNARLLHGRAGQMKVDHYAFMGTDDGYRGSRTRVDREGASRLHLEEVGGDHFSALPLSVLRYLERARTP